MPAVRPNATLRSGLRARLAHSQTRQAKTGKHEPQYSRLGNRRNGHLADPRGSSCGTRLVAEKHETVRRVNGHRGSRIVAHCAGQDQRTAGNADHSRADRPRPALGLRQTVQCCVVKDIGPVPTTAVAGTVAAINAASTTVRDTVSTMRKDVSRVECALHIVRCRPQRRTILTLGPAVRPGFCNPRKFTDPRPASNDRSARHGSQSSVTPILKGAPANVQRKSSIHLGRRL